METNEKLGQILQLCLQLQQSGWGDVFFNIEGHVNKVCVRGYKGGFKEGSELSFSMNAYYSGSLKDYEDEWTSPLSLVLSVLDQLTGDNS